MARSNSSFQSTQLRLSLSPHLGSGSLDGAWWPHSRNFERELADLIDHFPPGAGHVDRVLFSRSDWLTNPSRVEIDRGFIKTGSFPNDDTHLLVLKLSTGVDLNVLVIPPETTGEAARAILLRAATPYDGPLSVSALLTTAVAGPIESEADGGSPAVSDVTPYEDEPAHPAMDYVSTDEDADYQQEQGGEG